MHRYGFKTVELNGENEKNHWVENPIHTYRTTRVSIIIYYSIKIM